MNGLYQEILLEHNKAPHHFGVPEHYCCSARGHNPTCGDDLMVYLGCDEQQRVRLHFSGEACAVATASASLMSEALDRLPRAVLAELCEEFIQAVEQGAALPAESRLQKLAVLLTVRQFPSRRGCATLPWKALMDILGNCAK